MAVAVAPSAGLADVTATINGAAGLKLISPLIYGTNQSNIPSTSDRLGGNRWTAYNWETNASNAGNDYNYQNDGYLSASNTPGAAVLPTLQANANNGHTTILTVPINGYVSADKFANGDVRNSGSNYLSTRFNVEQAVKGSAFSLSPNLSDGRVYQDEFVNWVNANKSATQQVMYTLDNEPDLWNATHAEVHPNAPTYAEVIQKNIDYATMIKSVSPDAKVLGAGNYGWTGFRSLQNAPDANGRNFQATYLAGMKAASDTAGKRLIDSLDFHYYPETRGSTGIRITGPESDSSTADARIQGPRSLWDPTYVENSWIPSTLPNGDKAIRLLPRTQGLINANYADTAMSVSEYNFGGGNHISGGIAQADTLGIFAEQGVYSANWWDLGNGSSYVNAAQRMYLNFDGGGSHFGDISLGSTISDDGTASIHASMDSAIHRLTMVLINKSNSAQTISISLQNLGFYLSGVAYQFNSNSAVIGGVVQIDSLGNVPISGNTLTFSMAPLSVTTIAAPLIVAPEPASLASVAVTAGLLLRRRR
ncbi:MAG: hypothetical protein JWM57_2914 [Phycisphaerales bacterium]|nr:hypothetical protein [Phycisphaerales bacterium]